MIEIQQRLDQLASEGYLLYVNGSPVFTSKLYQELGVTQVQSEPIVAVSAPTMSSGTRGLTGPEKKALWAKFVTEAKVPWRITNGASRYTVRAFAADACNTLIRILNDPAIDHQIFYDSVAHYYSSLDYPVTLSKYFVLGIWEDEYAEYKQRKLAVRKPGENKFED